MRVKVGPFKISRLKDPLAHIQKVISKSIFKYRISKTNDIIDLEKVDDNCHDGVARNQETQTKRQATQHECLPGLLGNGDK